MESCRRFAVAVGSFVLNLYIGLAPSLSAQTAATGGTTRRLEKIANVRRAARTVAGPAAVRIRGVVTAFSGRNETFFLQDETGGISVDRQEQTPVQVGQQLEVTGTLRPGWFVPDVLSDHIDIVGVQRPPPPLRPKYEGLSRGQVDSQWIEVSGVVHAARVSSLRGHKVLRLDLRMQGGSLMVEVFDFPAAGSFDYLVDSVVRVQGVCGSIFNDQRQPASQRLFVPRMDRIWVESAAVEPARIQLVPLVNLGALPADPAPERRVKVAGTVTYQNPGKYLYMQDQGAAVLVRSAQRDLFPVGSRVEAVGFISRSGYSPALEDAMARRLGPGAVPAPARVSGSGLITSNDGFGSAPYDGMLVQLHARIIDQPATKENQVWLLRDGATVFEAQMRQPLNGHMLGIGPGNEVNVTGICVVETGEGGNPESFRLLVRSPQDFAIVHTPFWEVSRLFLMTTLFLVTSLAVLAWAFQSHLSKSGVVDLDTLSAALVLRFVRASRLMALIALLIAVFDLVGWALGLEILKRVSPGYVPMMPNTALAFLVAAGCFLLGQHLAGTRRTLERASALLVVAIGAVTLVEYASGMNLFIDGLLIGQFSDRSAQGEPLRMAFVSALAFVLLGSSLLLNGKRTVLYAQWFSIGSGVVCILNLIGYLYGLENGAVSSYSFMAVHTAVCFLLLSVAVLFRSADAGVMTVLSSASLGGVMARRLIPASLLLPALIGWIRWQGEVSGLYDAVFGLAVFASANMAAFGLLIWTGAITLNRLDAARSQTERELRLLVEGTRDYAIFLLDQAGGIASWNGGAERIKGYAPQEVIGKHFSFLYEASDVTPEQSRQLAGQALAKAAEEGRFEEESWQVRRDGTRFWGHVVITVLKDKAGRLCGFSNVTRDATELKRATEDLVAACKRAEDANRAKSDFLATMSHEIRTPMNSILGMTDLVMETGLNSIQREYVERCRRAGANLLNLINDILDLAKIESSRFELEHIPFQLADLVRRTAELIGPKAEMKGIALCTHLTPATPLMLMGDPFRLQQLLINLLGNAVKFTEQGEISLKIAPCADGEPGHILFEVADSGIGIAEDKLGVIFDDFTQAESSTTRRFGGSGLGLGISRRLAHRMGGELTASSVLGKGSIFRFDARFDLSSEAMPLEPPSSARQLAGRRVLVIDGNPTNQLITSKMCFSWGMVPVETASLTEACELLSAEERERRPFSVAIMEVVTPGGDGYAAFLKMRVLCPDMPLIMISSDNKPGEATGAKALGAAGYAVNPVRSADLFRLIAAAVRSEEESELRPPADASDGAVARILIAEDSEDNRFLLEAYLTDQPYEVTFVDNGEEAVSAFQKEAFGLVLMDVQMPVMDGLKATELIRAFENEQGRSRTPILALTANAFQSDRELSQAAGCDGHLSKPISKETLVSAVKASVLPVYTSEPERQHAP
jgi:PAS domain S-box-containing protein